jgi:hypothetical protein
VFLYCIDTQYVRHGDIDPSKLFAKSDITAEVRQLLPEIPRNLASMHQTIAQAQVPEIRIGPHCKDPYPCPLIDHCWEFLPAHNVTTLSHGGNKAFQLLGEGIQSINDIPSSYNLTAHQTIQKKSIESKEPRIDKSQISEFLNTLKYPLYYLDFETFATAIPLYDNLRPYMKVPFQYSLHVQKHPKSESEHFSFLAEGHTDPRPEILANLQKLLGSAGSIVAYNAAFEKDALKKCCEFYPAFSDWYVSIESRFVDLMAPFRSFHYYHPDQDGSYSIKAVLPALTGMSYEGMDIQEGGTASMEYLRVTFGDVDEKERQKVRRQLEEYCKLDTEAMTAILIHLSELTC